MLFSAPTPTPSALLTERYRPHTVDGFIGLDKPKRICRNLIARPMEAALMFVGPSGVGKTTMALALAAEMGAELHHIPSQECDLAAIERIRTVCQHYPAPGKRLHLVLVDEADQMTRAAQTALLSMLDSTRPLPNTVWVFTGNSTDGLEDRFISRCVKVEFSSYGVASDATRLLGDVWATEAPADAAAPNFARLVKDANNNVRASLMALQRELLAA